MGLIKGVNGNRRCLVLGAIAGKQKRITAESSSTTLLINVIHSIVRND